MDQYNRILQITRKTCLLKCDRKKDGSFFNSTYNQGLSSTRYSIQNLLSISIPKPLIWVKTIWIITDNKLTSKKEQLKEIAYTDNVTKRGVKDASLLVLILSTWSSSPNSSRWAVVIPSSILWSRLCRSWWWCQWRVKGFMWWSLCLTIMVALIRDRIRIDNGCE